MYRSTLQPVLQHLAAVVRIDEWKGVDALHVDLAVAVCLHGAASVRVDGAKGAAALRTDPTAAMRLDTVAAAAAMCVDDAAAAVILDGGREGAAPPTASIRLHGGADGDPDSTLAVLDGGGDGAPQSGFVRHGLVKGGGGAQPARRRAQAAPVRPGRHGFVTAGEERERQDCEVMRGERQETV